MIYSFNIFGTLITRRVARPHGIFHVMQSRLPETDLFLGKRMTASFAEWRIFCEKSTRLEERREEITLDEIYDRLSRSLFIGSEKSVLLREMEIETEVEFVIAVPLMLERFRALAAEGHRILLISDTYLPREALARLLNRIDGSILNHAKLYISSELRLTKCSGSIFEHILDAEKIDPKNLHHTGNEYRGDYRVPKSLGIRTTLFRDAELRRWERIGDDHKTFRVPVCERGVSTIYWRARLPSCEVCEKQANESLQWNLAAGFIRASRIQGHSDRYSLGYSLAGPILLPFVTWVLREARSIGIRRLYFVARDGQILLKIASKLQAMNESFDIELRYLCGSRQAWHFSSIHGFGEREIDWLFETGQYLTLSKIGKRLGIKHNDLARHLSHHGMERIGPNTKLSKTHLNSIREVLLSDESLQSLVLMAAQVQRELLQAYLHQEDFSDGTTSAIVDVGWSGRIQDSLLAAMNQTTRPNVMHGFYFGLVRDTDQTGDNNRKYTYAVSPASNPRLLSRIARLTRIVELCTAADHGSTVRYERDGNKYVRPIFDSQAEPITKWGVQEFQSGALQFIEDFMPWSDIEARDSVLNRLASLEVYLRFQIPDKNIADVIGSFPYTTEQDGENLREFGMRMSTMQALSYCMSSRPRKQYTSLWPEGSAARSGVVARLLLHPFTRGLFDVILRPHWAVRQTIVLGARYLPYTFILYVKSAIPCALLQWLECMMSNRAPVRASSSIIESEDACAHRLCTFVEHKPIDSASTDSEQETINHSATLTIKQNSQADDG